MELLEEADLIVVNLNQNIRIIKRFFDSEVYLKYADKCFYIIGLYNEDSKFNRYNLGRKFPFEKKNIATKISGKSDNIGIIPYNINFSDAENSGKSIEYFLKNINIQKKSINYNFFSEIEKNVEMILKRLGIDIEMNKLGEAND